MESVLSALPVGTAVAAAAAAAGGLIATATMVEKASHKNRLNLPPVVPGLPIIGNLHQLTERKPHHTFSRWAEVYGPIYTIRNGASSAVVLNSTEVAKEALVSKFPRISSRRLSKALTVLTRDKKIVALSDHGDFHKMAKRHLMKSMLGYSAQKQFRGTRDSMIDKMLSTFHTLVTDDPKAPLNFREVFRNELFSLSLTQALGEDVSSIFVEEFGKTISREEIFNATVADMVMAALDIDWRELFPYLSWVPNRSFETRVLDLEMKRTAVMRALINQQKKRIARGEARVSYLDYLLQDSKLTDEQVLMMVWETVLEAIDSTLLTIEWTMYELAKHPEKQDRMYQEIQEVCGNETVTEDHLPRLPYLNAVFHETLRLHSAVPIIPPRFVHENTSLGGYDIPAGTEVIINLYACNMDKNDWDEPEEWKPERFLVDGGMLDTTYLYKTLAFSAGNWVCAGSRQAANIVCASMARFVQEFAWKLKEGDQDQVDTIKITAARLHPLYVYLTPRG